MIRKKKNPNKVSGGAKAKHIGKLFEGIVLAACYSNRIVPIQIPTGCKFVRGYGGMRPIPQKSDFDFIIVKNKSAAFIDAKTTNDTTFTYSEITPHQVHKLAAIEKQGFNAGYLVWFRKVDNRIVFFTASKLLALKKGESLKVDDGYDLGTDLTKKLPDLLGAIDAEKRPDASRL